MLYMHFKVDGRYFSICQYFLCDYVTLMLDITDISYVRFIHIFSLTISVCFTMLSGIAINRLGIKIRIGISVNYIFVWIFSCIYYLQQSI